MPLLSPEQLAALIARADAVIEDTRAFAAALAEKLATSRASLRSIAPPLKRRRPLPKKPA